MKEWKIPNTNLVLTGYSRAADATYFYIPQLKISLDMGGTDKSYRSEMFFITHSHADHIICIPEAQPAFINLKNPNRIFAPSGAVPFLLNFMHGLQELNSMQVIDKEQNLKQKPFEVNGVRPKEVYQIIDNKYQVDIIECHHSLPTVGYAFSEVRMKLKKEFQDKPGKEIAELRKKGIEVQERSLVPQFVFLGDTTPKVFSSHPEILNFPVIIVECTFLFPEHLSQAENSDHTHWNQIEDLVRNNKKTTFVLIHFSLRYKDEEIVKFFDSLPGGKLDNVIPWVGQKG